MSEKPTPAANIDGMARLIEATLRRAETPLPGTLIAQAGALIRFCLRKHLAGNLAHPGLARMAKMGKCSERQARRNLRVLEAWGVMHPIAYQKGGRWATRYWVRIDALMRTLVALGCNPSSVLVAKSDQARADIRADICGVKWPDIMSAGILSNSPSQNRQVH